MQSYSHFSPFEICCPHPLLPELLERFNFKGLSHRTTKLPATDIGRYGTANTQVGYFAGNLLVRCF